LPEIVPFDVYNHHTYIYAIIEPMKKRKKIYIRIIIIRYTCPMKRNSSTKEKYGLEGSIHLILEQHLTNWLDLDNIKSLIYSRVLVSIVVFIPYLFTQGDAYNAMRSTSVYIMKVNQSITSSLYKVKTRNKHSPKGRRHRPSTQYECLLILSRKEKVVICK